MAPAIAASAPLASIDLSSNVPNWVDRHRAAREGLAFARALVDGGAFQSSNLKAIDLSGNQLGAEGAKAIAPALVRASLTSVR